MNKKMIAAALVAPILAFAPASAYAHSGKAHRHHHARAAEKGAYGSSKSMRKSGRTESQKQQDMTPSGGATDQGAGGSTGSGGKI